MTLVMEQNLRSVFEYCVTLLENVDDHRKLRSHPAYRMIVAMGQDVLSFIFQNLKDNKIIPWHLMLKEITRCQPTDWLDWGREHGYLRDEREFTVRYCCEFVAKIHCISQELRTTIFNITIPTHDEHGNAVECDRDTFDVIEVQDEEGNPVEM